MTAARLLLLGSTDLTLAVAERISDAGASLAGVVGVPPSFEISYSAAGVRNSRHVDMAAWCEGRNVPFWSYGAPDDLLRAAAESGAATALLAGWYHMVPARVRERFSGGCFGLHASLLPRYRGGAPLNWAMLNGDTEAGVTLFALTDGVDDGEVFGQERFAIAPGDYIGDVLRKAEAAALAVVDAALPGLLAGSLAGRPQAGEASYALQRQPSDGVIDWRHPAEAIARLVRSVSRPYPGARTQLEGTPIVVWRASAIAAPAVHGAPGQIAVLATLPSPAVATGNGLLMLEEVEGADGLDVNGLRRRHQRRFDVAG